MPSLGIGLMTSWFWLQVRVLRTLHHRNIVQFYGACLEPSSMFFVTELMKVPLALPCCYPAPPRILESASESWPPAWGYAVHTVSHVVTGLTSFCISGSALAGCCMWGCVMGLLSCVSAAQEDTKLSGAGRRRCGAAACRGC